MCISSLTPPIDPGMLPTASASTTLRRTVPFLRCKQAGGNFGEEVEQRVGTDGHDRRHPQAKDQNGEQQNAAPHAAHADEDAHDKANQNFGRYQWHSRSCFALLSRPVHADEAFALQVQNDFLRGFFGLTVRRC